MVLGRQLAVMAQMWKVHIIVLVHIRVRHEIGSHKEILLPFSFLYFVFHLTHFVEFHAQFQVKEQKSCMILLKNLYHRVCF